MEVPETEKLQALQLAYLDKAEKDVKKDIKKAKESDIESGKLQSEEVKCDKVKIHVNGFNGAEVAATTMILETVISDQDEANSVQDDDYVTLP